MPTNRYFIFDSDRTFIDRVTMILFCGVIVSLGSIQIRIPVGPLELGLTEVLFLLMFPIWALSLRLYHPTPHQKWILIAVAVYLLTGLVSAFFSISPRTSLKHMTAEIYLALLFIVSTTVINDFGKLKTVIASWLAGALIASFTALATIAVFYLDRQNILLEFLTYHYGSVPVGNFPRVTATFASASLFFNYLSVSIVLLLICQKVRCISQPICQVGFVAAMVSAIFTFSIGLGSFFLIAAWWLFVSNETRSEAKRRIRYILLLASFVWLVLALVALQPFPESPFTYRFPGTNFQIYLSARYLVWIDTFRTIGSHFLLGVGPGNPVCNVKFTNTDGTLSLLTDAHNTFVSVLAERGVIGALAIISTIALIIRRNPIAELNTILNPQSIVSSGLGSALLTGFVYQGLVGSFEDAKHLWVLMGIAVAVGELNVKENHRKANPRPG